MRHLTLAALALIAAPDPIADFAASLTSFPPAAGLGLFAISAIGGAGSIAARIASVPPTMRARAGEIVPAFIISQVGGLIGFLASVAAQSSPVPIALAILGGALSGVTAFTMLTSRFAKGNPPTI